MRLNTSQDIDAPIEFVFEKVADFSSFEMLLMNAGANISRTDDLSEIAQGMAWHVDGTFRGKQREIDVELENLKRPEKLKFLCETENMKAVAKVELEELSADQTRMTLLIEPEAKNISARLILQSMKLAKRSIENRVKNRLTKFSNKIEEEYQKLA